MFFPTYRLPPTTYRSQHPAQSSHRIRAGSSQLRPDIFLKRLFNRRGYLSRGIEDPLRINASHGSNFAGGGANENFGRRGEVLRGQVLLDELETGARHNFTQNISGDTRQAARRKWRGQNLAPANQENI